MSTPVSSASVLHKLHQEAPSLPSVRACLQGVASLSDPERKALTDSPTKFRVSPEDEATFTAAALKTLASGDLDQELGDAANGAAEAVNGILELISALLINLAFGDAQHGTNLTDQYVPILRLYCETMRDGIPLSKKLAQYAEDFDNKVIAFCADTSLTTTQRLEQIQEYIQDAEASQSTALEMQSRLESVFDKTMDFVNMVNSGDWEKNAQGKTFPVPKSASKLVDIPAKLEIPALGLALNSPFGPYVTIGGLLGIGTTEATNAAYVIAASLSHRERVPMEKVLSDLAEGSQSDGMDETNTKYFNEFREHIGVLSGNWQSVLIDARKIEAWLKDGAELVDIPKYMETALNGGVKIYVEVAKYLRSYAEQTNKIPWDEWLNAGEELYTRK